MNIYDAHVAPVDRARRVVSNATPADPVPPATIERSRTDRFPVIGTTAGNSKFAAGLALLASVFTMMPARADDADFARQKKCMNCHAIDEKRVGPAYRSVAARYANDKDAEARLARKIREGGAGSWGVVPMPSNDVTAAEAQRLAHWVLTQK